MPLLPYLILAGTLSAAPQVGNTQEAAPLVQQPAGSTAATPGARLAADQPIPPAELETFVDAIVRQTMSTDHIVGASVAVVQDDRVVLEKGYGWADLEGQRPVNARTTLFRIGSITKTFTWIAVMNAVTGGTLALDYPVNDHLPGELRIPEQGFSTPIRIRHLMTHTPGFEDSVLGHLFVREPERVRPLTRYLEEERVDRVREPGLVSTYSNYGVALAGAILERLHGKPWQEIVESEILVPLGMLYTTGREPYPPHQDLPAPMPPQLAEHVSKGYRWAGTHYRRRAFEYITQVAPAGSMSASAGDMARYMRMLLNDGTSDGVRVFGEAAASAFRTAMTDLPGSVGNWAGGFWETRLPGGFRNYGHDGGTTQFFSSMVLVPELRLGIFVTTNTEGGGNLSGSFAARLVEHFYAAARTPASGSPELAEARGVYQGYYLMTRRPYSGLESFLFRLQALPVTVTPDGFLALPLLGRALRFLPGEQPDEFHAEDVTSYPIGGVRFTRDGQRAMQMDTLVMAFERVGPLYQPPTLATLAASALIIAFGTLHGARVRSRRALPRTRAQRLAGWLLVATAITWIASAAAIAVFAAGAAGDLSEVVFSWPSWSMRLFSISALAATVLSVCSALFLPAVWRAGDRPGWSRWRALRFTIATLTFVALGVLLAMWGALRPW
jgi:CubicO group peptidase (beta-lactamase class C family)